MSKDKNIVRLNYQGMSQRSICRTPKVSDRRVRNTIQKMKDLNLTYDDIKDMDDDAFDELFTDYFRFFNHSIHNISTSSR